MEPKRHEIPCVACRCNVLVLVAESTAERDQLITRHGWQNQSRGTVCPECAARPARVPRPPADDGDGKKPKKAGA